GGSDRRGQSGNNRAHARRHDRSQQRRKSWRHGGDRWTGQTTAGQPDRAARGGSGPWHEYRSSHRIGEPAIRRNESARPFPHRATQYGESRFMSPSRLFILRPVATTLLMVGVLLVGWVA